MPRVAVAGLAVVVVALVVLCPGTAPGTTPFLEGREASLVPRGAVVAGTVRSATVRRGAGAAGRPRNFTHYEFEDLQVFSGEITTSSLIVPVVGGRLDGIAMVVPEAPQFEIGRRYLILYDPSSPLCAVSGWGRGAFRIESVPGLPDRVCFLDGRPAGGVLDGRVHEGSEPALLDEFAAALRRAARAAEDQQGVSR